MKLITQALFAASILATATSASAATTIVDVDGMANTSLDGSNSKVVALAAGTYAINFTNGAYSAFNRFGSVSGCNSSGAACGAGFEDSVRYIINGATFLFGDGNASGGGGPQSTGGYYSTAAVSLAAASKYAGSFTLTAPTNVSFYLYDDNTSDNIGGVSVALTGAVPEPASWAMMILGMGAVGFAMRRRRTISARLSYAV